MQEQNDKVIQNLSELGLADQREQDTPEEDGESDHSEEEDEEEGEEVEEDDDEGWITPANLSRKKRQMNGQGEEDQERVKVACLTTDFAMQVCTQYCSGLNGLPRSFFQNVLKQMGLHVLSADGLLIRRARTWIRRCYACFATTSDMARKFCPKCGNATLKRVSCTREEDGSTKIHISGRRKLTGK